MEFQNNCNEMVAAFFAPPCISVSFAIFFTIVRLNCHFCYPSDYFHEFSAILSNFSHAQLRIVYFFQFYLQRRIVAGLTRLFYCCGIA